MNECFHTPSDKVIEKTIGETTKQEIRIAFSKCKGCGEDIQTVRAYPKQLRLNK